MESLLRDLRYSIRMLLRNPGFTAVALLSLALGIGADTTIFSVFASIMFRSAPVKEPDGLALLYETRGEQGGYRNLTHAAGLELRKQSQVFEDWTATPGWGAGPVTLSGKGKSERGRLHSVGPEFFSVVGIQPALGRSFGSEFTERGESQDTVISHGLWQRFFGADPKVLGQTISIEGFKKTIVGVMPPNFWVYPWAKNTDVWLAYDLAKMPKLRWLGPFGRLKQGVTIEQAQAEMDVISKRFEELDPEVNKGWVIQVEGLKENNVRGYTETLYVLLGAVSFVLLIACANVANLLLARAASRQKEIAVRASMGATRSSLLQQLLTESLVLAVLGGALGILLSFWGIRIFVAMAPTWFVDVEEISIDFVVLGFALGISLVSGVLFGLIPAMQASKSDLHESLKEGGRSSRSSRRHLRNALVVGEVALALVLLVGAGLMMNSFLRLQQVDSGFSHKNILLTEVFLAGTRYWDYAPDERKRVTPQGLAFFKQVLERIRALPGVVSASTAGSVPPQNGPSNPIEIAGRATTVGGEPLRVQHCEVSPGFFETLKIPLLKGRYLTEQDVESSPWVVVINEAMAKELFPNEEPLGKSLSMSMVTMGAGTVNEERPREIVGVVGNVKRWGLKWGRRPLMYGSHEQHIWEYPGGRYAAHLRKDFVIRTIGNPMSYAREVQRIISEVDPDQVLYDIRTMEQNLAEMLARERFYMKLYGIFAALAVILAAVGIYGVMSYSVSQRTHEIGVRMAVGANNGAVLTLIIKQGLKLTLIGLAIGLGASFWLTTLVSSYLYGVSPTDPFTLAAVSIVLVLVAAAACYFPARGATKVDPLVALRHE